MRILIKSLLVSSEETNSPALINKSMAEKIALSQRQFAESKRLSTATDTFSQHKIRLTRPQTAVLTCAQIDENRIREQLKPNRPINDNFLLFNSKGSDGRLVDPITLKKEIQFGEVTLDQNRKISTRNVQSSYEHAYFPVSLQNGFDTVRPSDRPCASILLNQKSTGVLPSNLDDDFYLSAPTPSIPRRNYCSDYHARLRRNSVKAIPAPILKDSQITNPKSTLVDGRNCKENINYQGLGPNLTNNWLLKFANKEKKS